MRPLRLTIFLWILLVLTILSVLPVVIFVVAGILTGQADLTDLMTSIFVFLTIAPAAFSVFLVIKMFQMEAWARNWYIVLTVWSNLMSLIDGDFILVFISVVIHAFVFWNTWDEFY